MEVSGLDSEKRRHRVPRGRRSEDPNRRRFVRKLPGLERYPNVTLRRGITGTRTCGPACDETIRDAATGPQFATTLNPTTPDPQDRAAGREARRRFSRGRCTTPGVQAERTVAERQGQRDRHRVDRGRLRPDRPRARPGMAAAYSVPGVYYEPRPRAEPRALARTDVTGFIGFEPRVRRRHDADAAHRRIRRPAMRSGSTWSPFNCRRSCSVARTCSCRRRPTSCCRPTCPRFRSRPAARSPTRSWRRSTATRAVELCVVAGPASSTAESAPPTDEDAAKAAAGRVWVRIANVHVRRSLDGARVFPSVLPALPPARCDDWRDFELRLAGIPAIDDGTLLAASVRAYFANGGARCHVVTIRRPRFDDADGLEAAIDDLVGLEGASETEATGLERLLRIFEVAIVDLPDLYARRVDPDVPHPRAAAARSRGLLSRLRRHPGRAPRREGRRRTCGRGADLRRRQGPRRAAVDAGALRAGALAGSVAARGAGGVGRSRRDSSAVPTRRARPPGGSSSSTRSATSRRRSARSITRGR